MRDWKRSLWRVPLIALVSSLFWTRMEVRLLLRLAIERQADGTVISHPVGEALSYLIGLAVVLGLGGILLLRRQTRLEIFWSASVVVAYDLLLTLLQLLTGITTGSGAVLLMYLNEPLAWTTVPSHLLYILFQPDPMGIGYGCISLLLSCLTPYLFCLFGRRTEDL